MVGEWLCAWHATLGGLYRLEGWVVVVVVMVGGMSGREEVAIEGCSCPCKVGDRKKKKENPGSIQDATSSVVYIVLPEFDLGPYVGKCGGIRWGGS